MRDGRTNKQTTSEYRATQLLICEPLSLAIYAFFWGKFLKFGKCAGVKDLTNIMSVSNQITCQGWGDQAAKAATNEEYRRHLKENVDDYSDDDEP